MIKWDISYSDNSHIWGTPFLIKEGYDGFLDVPIFKKGEFDKWVKEVLSLEEAGIEMHFHYVERK